MKRVLTIGAAALMVVALAGSAAAQTVAMTATLNGSNEAPSKIVTGAFGTATVTYDPSTQNVSWVIDVFNMPSGINNAHFHTGGTDVAGPVTVNIAFPAQASNDFRLTGSAGPAALIARPEQGVRSWEDFVQSLLGGQVYINLHSNNNPGGEIRGQVIRQQ